MAIEDKPTAAWEEADLEELCTAQRREGPRLEFKEHLALDTDREKGDAEHDVEGIANAGGGHLLYGVVEGRLEDGSRVAAELSPLADGSLYERLNNVLDGRGDPKVPFELYAISASSGGIYLVVEVFSHRRPHQAQDARYYLRRNLQVRRMTEAEVREAYQDKFRRERVAAARGGDDHDSATDLPQGVRDRVHRGLDAGELALYVAATGEERGPGWLSVVATPDPPQLDLLDPTRLPAQDLHRITLGERRWNPREEPLTHFDLQATLNGYRAQLPSRDDVWPAYLVTIWRDGLMEFGDALEPALRQQEPDANRVVPSLAAAYYIHDYLALFLRVLDLVDYGGTVAIQVSFDDVLGHQLAVAPDRSFPGLHPLEEGTVRGRLWRDSRAALDELIGNIAKDALDRVFLAAGIQQGCYFIDDDGELLERR